MVFIDYQNIYKGARAAFTPETKSHVDGQINPLNAARCCARQRAG